MLCATLILCSVSPIAVSGRNDANYDGGADGIVNTMTLSSYIKCEIYFHSEEKHFLVRF